MCGFRLYSVTISCVKWNGATLTDTDRHSGTNSQSVRIQVRHNIPVQKGKHTERCNGRGRPRGGQLTASTALVGCTTAGRCTRPRRRLVRSQLNSICLANTDRLHRQFTTKTVPTTFTAALHSAMSYYI